MTVNNRSPLPQVQGGIAFVFPGGGSQYVGMGHGVYNRYQAAKRIFDEADAMLGFPLSQLCFEGPEDELTDTLNAQPATVTTSVAFLSVLRELAGEDFIPAYVAGHSTGEYTALLAAGALDLAATVRIVRERGRLMKEAGQKQPGAMAAVLGMDTASLQAICDEVGSVWLSNDNAPSQVVLSGKESAVEQALQLAMQRGARRTIRLAVNIASHCPLMAPAAEGLAATLRRLPLARATVPIVANVSASPIIEPSEIRAELVQHVTSLVRWVESVRYMLAQGVSTFLEIGPKDVLSGLIRRIDRSVKVLSAESMTEIEAMLR